MLEVGLVLEYVIKNKLFRKNICFQVIEFLNIDPYVDIYSYLVSHNAHTWKHSNNYLQNNFKF
jgi:hypothetical protein